MSLMLLCTDRNRRVLVLAGWHALLADHDRIAAGDLLAGLAWDAALPFAKPAEVPTLRS